MAGSSEWHRLLQERLSRRGALMGAAAAAAGAALPIELRAARAARRPQGVGRATEPPFRPIAPTTADALVLPEGFRYDLLRAWGDEVAPGVPFGYNADFTAFFPIDSPEGGRSSADGLLWVNHEYVNPLLMYGYRGGPKSAREQALERSAVGGSVMRVARGADGRWAFAADPRNRRVTGDTVCVLTGPAAGSAAVGGATRVRGSVGNCSGGATPWGTVLSCEENVDEYGSPPPPEGWGYGWDGFEPMHHGWVVEVDPFDPSFVPRKHTALGRFRHENVALRLAGDGRVVAYMGDDKRDSCVYRFVSDDAFVPGERDRNLRLLERGTLWAADFANGRWLALDLARQPRLRELRGEGGAARFATQADVLADARAAALALGATPVDRPEDIEIHPTTGEVFVALTNNSAHGNFHGQIVRIREGEGGADPAAFRWDFFAVGGPQSGFSSPDNLLFDPHGNLWMATDISSSRVGKPGTIYDFQGNNALFFFATEGPEAGRAVQFASGPVDCELTGPWWTPDGSTLFLAVQHPGEETEELAAPTSRWPHGAGALPAPGVVAITGFTGWDPRRSFHAW